LPPEPEDALKELKGDLWRLQNDVKSALARWPYHNGLKALAVKVGVKP
jgi:hypothetical protein